MAIRRPIPRQKLTTGRYTVVLAVTVSVAADSFEQAESTARIMLAGVPAKVNVCSTSEDVPPKQNRDKGNSWPFPKAKFRKV